MKQTDLLGVSENVNGVDFKFPDGTEGLFEAQRSATGLIELYEASSVEEADMVPAFNFAKRWCIDEKV